jgi:hypothetical protein
VSANELGIGTRVELRKHAREREAENARVEETPTDARFHYHEGIVENVVPENSGPRYIVKWENWLSTRTTHPASDLKVVKLDTGKRKRHEELYGPHGLLKQVEAAAELLMSAKKELWADTNPKRDFLDAPSYGRADLPGLEGAVIFDMRRETYEKLVKDFNRKARIHDRDSCC